MAGESPLSMMRQPGQRLRKVPAAAGRRRRPLWPAVALAVVAVALLAVGWTWLWYYAAQVADRTLAGWVEREAAAGRVYSCATQTIGGFPFRIEARCDDAGAALNSNQPPYAFKAKNITVVTEVYRPTRLVGDITGPLRVAEKGQPPSFIADWTRARVSVRGLPPYPDSISVTLNHPRLDEAGGNGDTKALLFQADRADLEARMIGGSARANPVIEAVLHLAAAAAPTLHALAAEPTRVDIDAVLSGFKNLEPKPWTERFREMQAADGGIDIKFLRIEQANAVIVGKGKLTLNPQGRLDGMINVAVAGLENIVPQLGIDRVVAHGVNRLTGAAGKSAQGANALDRLAPGLSGALRDSVNASVVDNLKKMGKPAEIDNKPATILPLRFADGSVYLGILLIGEVPPLF
jgi:hypothetical protein